MPSRVRSVKTRRKRAVTQFAAQLDLFTQAVAERSPWGVPQAVRAKQAPKTSKRCSDCRRVLALESFHKNRLAADGREFYCRQCKNRRSRERRKAHPAARETARAAHLLRTYGISRDQYEALLVDQGGVCAICGQPERTTRRMAVDHDHKTGKIRGILCHGCNTGLGAMREKAEVMAAAIRYLERAG